MSKVIPNIDINTDSFLDITKKLIKGVNTLAFDSFNTRCSDKDNNGIFQKIEKLTKDNKLIYSSQLYNKDANGNYTQCVVKFYDDKGKDVVRTEEWTLTYDEDGDIASKEVVIK